MKTKQKEAVRGCVRVRMFDIKVWDDIMRCCADEEVKEDVDKRKQLFYPIDTSEATNNLINVKTLLEVAYSGSKNFHPGTTAITEALATYSGVVKTAARSFSTSTNVAIEALSFHKHASLFAEKGKPRKACAFLGKCGHLAQRLSAEYKNVIIELTTLSASLMKAIAKFAESENDEKDQPFSSLLNQLRSYLENMRQKEVVLLGEIKKAKETHQQKNEPRRKAKEGLTKRLLCPISYIENVSADIKSIQLKLALQKDGQEFNNGLRAQVCAMAESDFAQNGLRTSVVSMMLAVKLVVGVMRIFDNSCRFWNAVEYAFDVLPSSSVEEQLCDDDVFELHREPFLLEIKASFIGWLTTGNSIRQSAELIRDVSHGLNRSRPPILEVKDGERIISELSTKLLSDIAMDDERVDDVTIDCLYEILMAKIKEPKEEIDNNSNGELIENSKGETEDSENEVPSPTVIGDD